MMRAWILLSAILCGSVSAADFNGDGKLDAVWRRPDGSVLLQEVDGNGTASLHPLGPAVEPAWIIAATPDVDGDGRSDLLWLRADGAISLWRAPDFALTDSTILPQTFGAGWELAGTGDVDGDGKDDLLWRDGNGQLEAWIMDGLTVRTQVVFPPVVDPAWHVVGVGDFDGDGHADVIWRSDQGAVAVWLLDAGGVRATGVLPQAVAGDARPEAIADLDGDRRADVVWAANGGHALWLMDGMQARVRPLAGEHVFADGFDGDPPAFTRPGAGWTIAQSGDADADGTADLVATDTAGEVALWHLAQGWIDAVTPLPAQDDMPYPLGNGWAPPLARPRLTVALDDPAHLVVEWDPLPGLLAPYRLGLSAVAGGAQDSLEESAPSVSLDLADPRYASVRYATVDSTIAGIALPPGPRGYRVGYALTRLDYWGALGIADIDRDGCLDILGSRGDCAGGFSPLTEQALGLADLRAPGRVYRDVRMADFDGDGIDDLIANVYSPYGDPASRILFYRGQPGGGFAEDAAFTAPGYGGYGETIVVADFDNNGTLDIFLPQYTHDSSSEQNLLLLNDGLGHFTESADSAGVAMRGWPAGVRVEGAQAADINDDGWIDLYVGSHLFINQGVATGHLNFIDRRADMGLPLRFDEGAKFIDWNNDGLLDLVTLAPVDPATGPAVWTFDGRQFQPVPGAFPAEPYNQAYGLNAADLDGDGRTDIVVAGGCGKLDIDPACFEYGEPHAPPRLFLNRPGTAVGSVFLDDGLTPTTRMWNDLQTFADFDGNGSMDAVSRFADTDPESGSTSGLLLVGLSLAQAPDTMHVRLLDEDGSRNQYGRVVRVWPLADPSFVMTGVVDGGSGYMANTPYDLAFAAPYAGAYRYQIRFSNGVVGGVIHPGESLAIQRDGLVAPLAH